MRTTLGAIILSLCWCALFLSMGIFAGWITISFPAPWLMNPAAFVYRHLRLSIVPFGCLLLLYAYITLRMRKYLGGEDTKLSQVTYYDRLLNATIATFFGVGVIWTAVGMESALTHALEGVGEGMQADATLSAFGLMERLVNGGLLLALSTTIFGGVCGYFLRMLKIVFLGKEWDRFVLDKVEENGKVSAA